MLHPHRCRQSLEVSIQTTPMAIPSLHVHANQKSTVGSLEGGSTYCVYTGTHTGTVAPKRAGKTLTNHGTCIYTNILHTPPNERLKRPRFTQNILSARRKHPKILQLKPFKDAPAAQLAGGRKKVMLLYICRETANSLCSATIDTSVYLHPHHPQKFRKRTSLVLLG